MSVFLHFEIQLDNRWHLAAELDARAPAAGYAGRSYLKYDMDYALGCVDAKDSRALSSRFPVSFALHSLPHWPAFALDLLPSGNARRVLTARYGLSDGLAADIALLAHAQYAPGNVRVRPAEAHGMPPHPGFLRKDILARKDNFIEYAHEHGASVAGSSGAQGDAPKFLLVQDTRKRWHSVGALADKDVRAYWLVKFPRGRSARDRLVLRTEAAYLRVAKALGLTVEALPTFADDTLFVPRFDRRVRKGGVDYYGLESLCSLAGRSEFGASIPQETLCEAIVLGSTNAAADVIEFVKRDILNVMLGNTDNHARNSAMLKTTKGEVRLSPLYDFAPMMLDPEGIARSCRWSGAESGGFPDWEKVIALVAEGGAIEASALRAALAAFARKLRVIDAVLKRCRVDREVIALMQPRIKAVRESLAPLVGKR